jgi:hypothetical protein
VVSGWLEMSFARRFVVGLLGWAGLDSGLTDPTGKHVAFHERFFELSHANAFLVHHIFGRSTREESREAVVEVDQILSYTPTFGLVGFEDCAVGGAVDHGAEFPAEIVGVLHAYVHALAGFWTGDDQLVGVAGVRYVALTCGYVPRHLPGRSARVRRTCRLRAVRSGMLSTSHSTYR